MDNRNKHHLEYERLMALIPTMQREANAFEVRTGVNPGTLVPVAIPAKDIHEIRYRFFSIYAPAYCELYKSLFMDTYRIINMATVTNELARLEDFTTAARKIPLHEAISAKHKSNIHHYRILESKMHEADNLTIQDMYRLLNQNSAKVYGKYFLLRQWLESLTRDSGKTFFVREYHDEIVRELQRLFIQSNRSTAKELFDNPNGNNATAMLNCSITIFAPILNNIQHAGACMYGRPEIEKFVLDKIRMKNGEPFKPSTVGRNLKSTKVNSPVWRSIESILMK